MTDPVGPPVPMPPTYGLWPVLRQATGDDLELLAEMLVEATNWDGMRGTTRATVEADPKTWRYLDGWQRATDFGVVAQDGTRSIGAAWARFGTTKDAGYGYVSDDVPEVTIAVSPEARGRGVGRAILAALMYSAQDLGVPGLSLSVEDGNRDARALYEKVGYIPTGRNGNADTMMLALTPPALILPSAEPSAG